MPFILIRQCLQSKALCCIVGYLTILVLSLSILSWVVACVGLSDYLITAWVLKCNFCFKWLVEPSLTWGILLTVGFDIFGGLYKSLSQLFDCTMLCVFYTTGKCSFRDGIICCWSPEIRWFRDRIKQSVKSVDKHPVSKNSDGLYISVGDSDGNICHCSPTEYDRS